MKHNLKTVAKYVENHDWDDLVIELASMKEELQQIIGDYAESSELTLARYHRGKCEAFKEVLGDSQ